MLDSCFTRYLTRESQRDIFDEHLMSLVGWNVLTDIVVTDIDVLALTNIILLEEFNINMENGVLC